MRTTGLQGNYLFPMFCDGEVELSREDFVIALEFNIGIYLGDIILKTCAFPPLLPEVKKGMLFVKIMMHMCS